MEEEQGDRAEQGNGIGQARSAGIHDQDKVEKVRRSGDEEGREGGGSHCRLEHLS